jgi:hypothetical protein
MTEPIDPVVSDKKNMSACAEVGEPALMVTVLWTVTLSPTPIDAEYVEGLIESARAGPAIIARPRPTPESFAPRSERPVKLENIFDSQYFDATRESCWG